MDAQLKAKWVEALRSGEYQQTKSYLHDIDGYCCLGVLCDVSGEGHWVMGGSVFRFHHGEDDVAGFLPTDLALRTGVGAFEMRLSNMNDNGNDFSIIADYIEANIPADTVSLTSADRATVGGKK
jgi:hypothetical protein